MPKGKPDGDRFFKQIRCSLCGKKIATITLWIWHGGAIHNLQLTPVCDRCSKSSGTITFSHTEIMEKAKKTAQNVDKTAVKLITAMYPGTDRR